MDNLPERVAAARRWIADEQARRYPPGFLDGRDHPLALDLLLIADDDLAWCRAAWAGRVSGLGAPVSRSLASTIAERTMAHLEPHMKEQEHG
jgi:hypothetical protein